jgi:peptidoglycan/LPS O-acetylase OafA/YrhL
MQPGVERIASRTASLEGIQILRAIAALIVVLHHSLEESMAAVAPFKSPDWLTTFGASGVDIFFVISGFIMFCVSFPTDQDAASPISFLVKRVTRIYPFYWFCVALVLGFWSIGLFHSLQLDTDVLIRSIFLFPSEHLIINVSWTLVYEMYFYLIFAATLTLRRPLISLFGTSGAILILYTIGHFAPDAAVRVFLSNAIAVEFCFGADSRLFVSAMARIMFSSSPTLDSRIRTALHSAIGGASRRHQWTAGRRAGFGLGHPRVSNCAVVSLAKTQSNASPARNGLPNATAPHLDSTDSVAKVFLSHRSQIFRAVGAAIEY